MEINAQNLAPKKYAGFGAFETYNPENISEAPHFWRCWTSYRKIWCNEVKNWLLIMTVRRHLRYVFLDINGIPHRPEKGRPPASCMGTLKMVKPSRLNPSVPSHSPCSRIWSWTALPLINCPVWRLHHSTCGRCGGRQCLASPQRYG